MGVINGCNRIHQYRMVSEISRIAFVMLMIFMICGAESVKAKDVIYLSNAKIHLTREQKFVEKNGKYVLINGKFKKDFTTTIERNKKGLITKYISEYAGGGDPLWRKYKYTIKKGRITEVKITDDDGTSRTTYTYTNNKVNRKYYRQNKLIENNVYMFDVNGRLISEKSKEGGVEILYEYIYKKGKLMQVTGTSKNVAYTYSYKYSNNKLKTVTRTRTYKQKNGDACSEVTTYTFNEFGYCTKRLEKTYRNGRLKSSDKYFSDFTKYYKNKYLREVIDNDMHKTIYSGYMKYPVPDDPMNRLVYSKYMELSSGYEQECLNSMQILDFLKMPEKNTDRN